MAERPVVRTSKEVKEQTEETMVRNLSKLPLFQEAKTGLLNYTLITSVCCGNRRRGLQKHHGQREKHCSALQEAHTSERL